MPTSTFNIATSADDSYANRTGVYPPTGGTTWGPTSTLSFAEKNAAASPDSYSVALLRFNTSSLPDDAVVTEATLRVYITSKDDADGRSITWEYYPWTGSDPNDFTVTAVGSAHAGTALSAISTGAFRDFALSGLENINKGGYTSLRGVLSGGQPAGNNQLRFASFDDASNPEPLLLVTYELGGDLVGIVGI